MNGKTLSFLFAAMLAGQAMAADFEKDGLYYNITSSGDNNTVELVRTGGDFSNPYTELTTVDIPETVMYNEVTYLVTSVGERAFYYCDNLETVTGTSITNIGQYAFNGCSALTSATFGDNLQNIGLYAFSACVKLESFTFGPSVKSIGEDAFAACYSLDTVIIPETVTDMGIFAFYGCKGLKSVTINTTNIEDGTFFDCKNLEDITFGNSVKTIGEKVLFNCSKLKNVTIGNAVDTIGDMFIFSANKYENLVSVTVPNTVKSIGVTAFWNVPNVNYTGKAKDSPWGAITVNGLIEDGFIYADAKKEKIMYYFGDGGDIVLENTVKSLNHNLFGGCEGLQSITLPESLEEIGNYAFDNCKNLKTINISNSVTNIGSSAFNGCESLEYNEYDNALYLGNAENPYLWLIKAKSEDITSCEINSKCKYIYEGAFFNCAHIASLTVPNTIESIGSNAFRLVRNVAYSGPANGASWGAQTYNGVIDGDFIYHDASKTLLAAYTGNAESVTIPSTVKGIKNGAFCQLQNLKKLVVPNSVDTIYNTIINNCNNLEYNEYHNAFYLGNDDNPYLCLVKAVSTQITECYIHSDCRFIFDNAFQYCSKLEIIDIPNSVKFIGSSVFDYCNKLSSVDLPNSLTRIESFLFNHCNGLTEIDIPETVEYIGGWAFANCHNLESINIPDAVTAMEDQRFYESQSLKFNKKDGGLYLGNDNNPYIYLVGVTAKDTTTFSINENCKFIGDYAFNGFMKLQSVTIPNTVRCIGGWAFSSDTLLSTITIPISTERIGSYAFEYCYNLTIRCEADSIPIYWAYNWNPKNRPVVWNCNGTANNQGGENNNQGGGNENQGGNENNPGTAVSESTATAVNIYAHGNTIVVENSTEEIFVYNAMGTLICREVACRIRPITVNATGVYIVKTGNVVKRLMIN